MSRHVEQHGGSVGLGADWAGELQERFPVTGHLEPVWQQVHQVEEGLWSSGILLADGPVALELLG